MRSFSVCAFLLLGSAVSGAHWGYDESNGPSTWASTYPDCGGKFQSPIDINVNSPFLHYWPVRLQWIDFDKPPKTMTVTNNGHSLALSGNAIGNGTTPILRKFFPDNSFDSYALDGVHFHWGKGDDDGSEHTIGGRRYTLEMHAVFKKIDFIGGSLQVAAPLDIIVVSQLFLAAREPNPVLRRIFPFAPLVKLAGTSVSLKPFAWSALIQPLDEGFFVYRGSLTTPPCTEAVTFFIRTRILKVSYRQMEDLRTLLNEEKEEISGNVRTTQPSNGRRADFYRVVNFSQ